MSNGKVAYLAFKDDFTDVEPKLDKTTLPSKFAAFGRVKVDIKNLEIHINNADKLITIQAELYPTESSGLFDIFNFDYDPTRGQEWNLATEIVHRGAPPGSTSYIIYGKGVSFFKKSYSFKDFF